MSPGVHVTPVVDYTPLRLGRARRSAGGASTASSSAPCPTRSCDALDCRRRLAADRRSATSRSRRSRRWRCSTTRSCSASASTSPGGSEQHDAGHRPARSRPPFALALGRPPTPDEAARAGRLRRAARAGELVPAAVQQQRIPVRRIEAASDRAHAATTACTPPRLPLATRRRPGRDRPGRPARRATACSPDRPAPSRGPSLERRAASPAEGPPGRSSSS